MKKFDWKKLLPHAYAIGIFLLVAVIYCKPAIQGKVLQQSDITQWKGMSKDILDFKEKHGEAPLWTNSMFSGMPGYLIAGKTNNNVPYYFAEAISFFLGKPFQFFFLACICFYFLAQVLRTNTWISIIGALAYAYATYNPIIVSVGHDTKMLSIALIPGFIASILLIYERKYLWGAALTAFFTGSLISQNHYQIIYYGLIIAVFMTIGFGIKWILAKDFKHLFIAGSLTLFAGLLGVFSNAVVILPNYEYTQETIRGGSVLADGAGNTGKEGLSESYAFSYSMSKAESFVLLIPRILGGSTNHLEVPQEKSKAVEALQSMQPEVAQQLQSNLGFYWGEGHTSGPPYAGAVMCFLAIMGFAILDNNHKWWILGTIIITLMMSWGINFKDFNTFLFDHLPMYNKFRAPGMIIVVPVFLVCMMAILALQKLLFGFADQKEMMKKFKLGLMLTGGVFAAILLVYFSLDYKGASDNMLLQQISQIQDAAQKAAFESGAKSMINGLIEDRKGLFMGDIMRSLMFIAAAAGAIFLYNKKIIKSVIALLAIGILSFVDVMAIDVNYLSSENYQDVEENDASFIPSVADQQILQDKSYYRVFNVVGGNVQMAFNHGAINSYFHKSIGGYHPAKLSIYQDLIEKQLYKFPNCQPVINMLNTKYIIYGDQQNPKVQINPDALGAAWFVKGVRFENGPKEEMAALDNLNTKDSAVADKSFSNVLKGTFSFDSSATINFVKNENDSVRYTSNASTDQLAVFSEVYYDKGWNAYVDGKQVPYAKVNYVLRGMVVPAGEHTIEFKFEPKSHATGWMLTNICSFIMLLLLFVAIVIELKNKKAKTVSI